MLVSFGRKPFAGAKWRACSVSTKKTIHGSEYMKLYEEESILVYISMDFLWTVLSLLGGYQSCPHFKGILSLMPHLSRAFNVRQRRQANLIVSILQRRTYFVTERNLNSKGGTR